MHPSMASIKKWEAKKRVRSKYDEQKGYNEAYVSVTPSLCEAKADAQ